MTALTFLECDAIAWAAQGKTVLETARIRRVTIHTTRKHVLKARQKLNAATMAGAVAIAIENRLISRNADGAWEPREYIGSSFSSPPVSRP